jgi:hypothetical protein
MFLYIPGVGKNMPNFQAFLQPLAQLAQQPQALRLKSAQGIQE